MRAYGRTWVAGIAALSGLALAGCTSGSDDSPAAMSAPAATAAATMSAAASGSAVGETYDMSSESRDGAGSNPDAKRQDSFEVNAAVAATDRQIIYTATMTVEAERNADISAKVAEVATIAKELGGRIDGQNITKESAHREEARLVVKVPPAQYAEALKRFAALGEQRSLEQSTDDVTASVADLESRARTQRISIARIRDLMDRATTIKDIVTLEAELSQREADLDSAVAKAKALRGQASMGTITLQLFQKGELPALKAEEDRTGFVPGLKAGWGAFTGFVVAVLTAFGALAPFLVPVALIGVPLLILRKRRRAAAPTAEAEPTLS